MRTFRIGPRVAAYKSFIRENEFRRIRLLTKEIRVLTFKCQTAMSLNRPEKAKQIEQRIESRENEIVSLKQSLAEKYNIEAVLAGFEEHKKGFAAAVKWSWECLKIIAPTLGIAAITIGVPITLIQPALPKGLLGLSLYLLCFLPGITLTCGYFLYKVCVTHTNHDYVVEIATEPWKSHGRIRFMQ
jgi:hypothetical protein